MRHNQVCGANHLMMRRPRHASSAAHRSGSIDERTRPYIEPCSPWENGYCESFNSKLRDEFADGKLLHSMKELLVLSERWRIHYSAVRPHSSLGSMDCRRQQRGSWKHPSVIATGHITYPPHYTHNLAGTKRSGRRECVFMWTWKRCALPTPRLRLSVLKARFGVPRNPAPITAFRVCSW